jgi:hypothetical protein
LPCSIGGQNKISSGEANIFSNNPFVGKSI